MNFYVDSGGAILGVDPEKIYQGSANANTIRFVGAFASNVKVTVAFKLPTGVWTTPQLMTASTQLAGVVTSNGVQFNVWEYSIPAVVTETFGTVNMQFYVYGDAGSGNGGLIATASSSFQVERGVPITLPDPTDDYETLLRQILSALSQIQGKLNFDDTPTIGSQNPVTSDGIAKALNTKASLQEDNTFEGYNTFQNEAYFDNAAYFDAGAFMYGMNYYLTDGPNRNDYYCYLTYNISNISKILIRFFMSDDQFDIEIPQKGGTIALLSDLTPIEEEVSKKYDKTGGTIDGDVTVTGDLTVQGTTITENAETLDVKANVITTNSEGAPLINLSGLGIRTNATNVYGIMYDPQSDSVKLGLGSLDEDNNFTFNQGEGLPIAVRDDSTAFTDKHVIVWDAAGDKFVDGGGTLDEKLDKVTGTNTVPRAYTVTETGEQSMTDLNSGIAPYTIVYRNSAGYFDVLDPAQYTNPVSLRYYNQNVPIAVKNSYATQTELANTQRQVDGLYTLLEQKNEIYVQTATDTYTTRETAGGENIADGVQTPVKKITGKTVKTTNLIPYPYYETPKTVNGVTWNVNNDGTITINGTATELTTFWLFANNKNLPAGISVGGIYTISLKGGNNNCYIYTNYVDSAGEEHGAGLSSHTGNTPTNTVGEEWKGLQIYIVVTQNATLNNVTVYPMLNEGSTAKPYIPYFSGLKNAFFKEIVSTGRNLIPYPNPLTSQSGITFTENEDGTFYANGTAEKTFFVFVSSFSLSAGTYYLSGTPEGGSSSTYQLYIINSEGTALVYREGSFSLDKLLTVRLWLAIYEGTTLNNLLFKPMVNRGSSALPYEPYTQSVLSLPEAVELTEYDTAYPETGEIQRQSNTITFNGTETWQIYTPNEGNKQEGYTCFETILSPKSVSPENGQNSVMNNYMWSKYGYASTNSGACQSTTYLGTNIIIKQNQFNTIDEWKAHLAALSEAGNPLTVTYKTAEATTEQADFSADSYIAWKNGSETIEQGDTDNSEYGAENTVEQDYYLLTAPQEVTKE